MSPRAMTRLRKRADLLSITGAGLAGVATGAGWGTGLARVAPVLLVSGLLMHAVGMTSRHRLDLDETGRLSTVWTVLYAACWRAIVLAARMALLLLSGTFKSPDTSR